MYPSKGESLVVTSSGAVVAEGTGAYVMAVSLAGGSAASTLTLKTGGSSGTSQWVLKAIIGGDASIAFPLPLYFPNGVYATLAGAGAIGSVEFAETA